MIQGIAFLFYCGIFSHNCIVFITGVLMTGNKKWYEKDLRRLLVDMHIPDWDEYFLKNFSAEKYADNMVKGNISCAEIYAGNCLGLCLWPSENGFNHKQLQSRDIFGETLEACKKRGLDVQIYFNVYHRSAFEAHPSWRMIGPGGKNTRELGFGHGRFGLCCINSPFGDFFLKIIAELDSKYDGVGFWIDMLGWWSVICRCESCKKRFREETGKDIPEMIDWNDPCFNEYIRWRASVLAQFAQKITDTVKKQHPERTVNIQSASAIGGWGGGMSKEFMQASEYLAGDFTGDHIEQAVICKLFSALSTCRPMEFMTPRCETLVHHTTTRTFENMLMRAYAAIANQAAFTLIDAIDPDGAMDGRFYEMAGKINEAYKEYEKYISGKSVILADTAIYYEFDSINTDVEDAISCDDTRTPASKQNMIRRNLARCFGEEHLLFTFTGNFDENITSDRYPSLILSDAARLSMQECENIRRDVANGGRLYACCCTSLFDRVTGKRKDFALADVFGVHYKGKTASCTYIAPAPGSFLNEYATEKYPVMLDCPQCLIEADEDTEILGTLVLPVSDPAEQDFFGSAISNPPVKCTNKPALTRHKYGKGEVIYCAGRFEEVPYDFQRSIFGRILLELRKTPLITSNVHPKVEFTLFDVKEEKRLLLSLLNQLSLPCVAWKEEISILLTLPEEYRIKKLLLAPEEKQISFQPGKNGLSFTLPGLEKFAMIVAEYE